MSVLDLMQNTMDIGQTTPNLSALPSPDPPTAWPALLIVLVLVIAFGCWLHLASDSPNKWQWGIPESWKRAAPILGFHLLSSWPVALALLIVWLES